MKANRKSKVRPPTLNDLPKNKDKGEWAHFYARVLKIAVIPLFETAGEICSCGNVECSNQGKHPRVKGGVHKATMDLKQIKKWWDIWPNANIGAATGAKTNLLALDCDTAETKALVEACGMNILSQITGSGNCQFFFRHEEGFKNWQGLFGGLDIRTQGGLVVLPPSSNKCGPYYWNNLCKKPSLSADLKARLFAEKEQQTKVTKTITEKVVPLAEKISIDQILSNLNEKSSKVSADEFIPKGARHNCLLRLGGSLRSKGIPEDAIERILDWVNENLCDPPLRSQELNDITKAVLKIQRAVNNIMDQFDAWMREQTWSGKKGATDKRVRKELHRNARRFGTKRQDGIAFVLGQNDIAKSTGISRNTVGTSLKRMSFVRSEGNVTDTAKSSTIVLEYPKGAQIGEHGEVLVNPFVRQEVHSFCPPLSNYLNGQDGIHSRWKGGMLGHIKADFLEQIIGSTGVGNEFRIADLDHIRLNKDVRKDYEAKRRHLSETARNDDWDLLEKVQHGVYRVPADFYERFDRYRLECGETKAQREHEERIETIRAAFRYHQDLIAAENQGKDLENVSVPKKLRKSKKSSAILEDVKVKNQKYRRRRENNALPTH